MMYEVVGTDPKKLRVFSDFWLLQGLAAVAALKRRGGCGAATFRWCGYDWRDSLYLGLVSAEAKAAYSVHLWYVVSAGPSKTSERAQPGPKRHLSREKITSSPNCNLISPLNLDHSLQTVSKGEVTTAFCKIRW